MKIVVIGHGMVGHKLLECIAAGAPGANRSRRPARPTGRASSGPRLERTCLERPYLDRPYPKQKPASRRLSKGTIEEDSDSDHRQAIALCAIQRARNRS